MSYLYNLKKKRLMKTKFLMLGMILSLMTISCSKKDNADSTTISADEAAVNAKFDSSNDDVSAIIEEQLDATLANSASGKGPELLPPSCPTVTRVPAFGITITPGTTVSKTIDFGTSCVRNGKTFSGIINIDFVYNPTATSHTVNYSFTNFYHNSRKFTGTKTFTRTLQSTPANTSIHPVVVMNMNMTMTTPDGRVFTRVGTRTREIIAGQTTTADLTDNVYQVTGNWTTTFPNTTVQTSTITSPIIVKLPCVPTNSALSQGIITFVRNTHTATLDYGNGSCDNIAIFTLDGVAHTITLN
jgi:hypothetical protein